MAKKTPDLRVVHQAWSPRGATWMRDLIADHLAKVVGRANEDQEDLAPREQIDFFEAVVEDLNEWLKDAPSAEDYYADVMGSANAAIGGSVEEEAVDRAAVEGASKAAQVAGKMAKAAREAAEDHEEAK